MANVPKEGELLEFTVFTEGNVEWPASGYIWAKGPRLTGGWTFWVVDVQVNGPSPWDSPLAVAVVKPASRHLVGLSRRGRWTKSAGRWIDKDHYYTEVHPKSPTGRLTARGRDPEPPPTSIKMKPLDDLTMRLLSGLT